jgi:hypothetical protein
MWKDLTAPYFLQKLQVHDEPGRRNSANDITANKPILVASLSLPAPKPLF